MQLICDKCHIEENVDLYAHGIIHFACGQERKVTSEDLRVLFKRYGGGMARKKTEEEKRFFREQEGNI